MSEFGLLKSEDFWKFSRDYERTPMQWSSELSTSSDFSFRKVKPWLPVSPNLHTINVQSELKDLNSHLWTYKRLSQIRRLPQFVNGSIEYAIVNEKIFSFLRKASKNVFSLVIMNLSEQTELVDVSPYIGSLARVLYNFGRVKSSANYIPRFILRTKSLRISPKSCLILDKL